MTDLRIERHVVPIHIDIDITLVVTPARHGEVVRAIEAFVTEQMDAYIDDPKGDIIVTAEDGDYIDLPLDLRSTNSGGNGGLATTPVTETLVQRFMKETEARDTGGMAVWLNFTDVDEMYEEYMDWLTHLT